MLNSHGDLGWGWGGHVGEGWVGDGDFGHAASGGGDGEIASVR